MLKVTGRVSLLETREGLPGLHVKAVDKDLFFDDVLGTAVTNPEGRFEITYDAKDFAELFDRAPDVYILVRDKQNRRILYSSEAQVRWEAGVIENFDVQLSRTLVGSASENGAIPYGPQPGRVTIRLNAPQASVLPEAVKVFFTEHRFPLRKQHVRVLPFGKELAVDLPSGEYTMQLHARGFETSRGLVEVDPRRPSTIDALLAPRTKRVRTFEEQLASYGIDTKKTEVGTLDVPPSSTRVLNYQQDKARAGFKMLEAESVARIKEWTGAADHLFGHDRPVFGPLPDQSRVAKLGQKGRDLRKLDLDEIEAIKAIAHEYINGNSKSVARYRPILDSMIKLSTGFEVAKIPLYFYRIVTIGAGATLEIGNGSAVFACDELRIHKTGMLKPVGSVTMTIGTYREFQ